MIKLKVKLLLILIVFLNLSSCHVLRSKSKNEDESIILERLISPSQDSSRTSIIIKVIDFDTEERIPGAQIILTKDNKEIEFEANKTGQLLISANEEGLCDIEIKYVGSRTLPINNLELSKNEDLWLLIGLSAVY